MHGRLTHIKVLATVTVSAVALGAGASAASVAAEPVVHVYDVQVTGTHRATLSLPSKPLRLDFAYSLTSRWTETYKGVRIEVLTSEFVEPTIELRNQSWRATKGTVTGSTKYKLSGPNIRSCNWSTSRSEPGSLLASGRSTTPAQFNLTSGRLTSRPPLKPPNCAYYEGNFAKFTEVDLGPDGGVATGYIDTRASRLALESGKPQQAGHLAFPLGALSAGTGFVLNIKGKTKDQAGRHTSEGAVRIKFIPRPA